MKKKNRPFCVQDIEEDWKKYSGEKFSRKVQKSFDKITLIYLESKAKEYQSRNGLH